MNSALTCNDPGAQAYKQSEYVLDKNINLWDNFTMSRAVVDDKKKILLPDGRPGDVFDIQKQDDGRYILVRHVKSDSPTRRSRAACLEAMRRSPLRMKIGWRELRKLTREQ